MHAPRICRTRSCGTAASPTSSAGPTTAPASSTTAVSTTLCRWIRGFLLPDDDPPGHPGPIMVGAPQRVVPGFERHKAEVLRLAGLQNDLGPVRVQHAGIACF